MMHIHEEEMRYYEALTWRNRGVELHNVGHPLEIKATEKTHLDKEL